MRPILAGSLLLLTLTPPSPAADWPVPRGPSREPAPCRYDPAQWEAVPRSMKEDISYCFLYEGISYRLEEDGTIEVTTHRLVRCNDAHAVATFGAQSLPYDSAYQTLTLNEARLHKPDGRVAPLPPENVEVRAIDPVTDPFAAGKQVLLLYPQLGVGDCVESKWTTRGKPLHSAGQLCDQLTLFFPSVAVVRVDYKVLLPKGRDLHSVVVGGQELAPEVSRDDAGVLYRWRTTDERVAKGENPAKMDAVRYLIFTTYRSWDDVASEQRQRLADRDDCPAEARRLALDLTRGLTTETEKVRALVGWARANLRSLALGRAQVRPPRPPAQVFADRYGDSRDQSQLLAVMLRAVGVSASLAYLNTRENAQMVEAAPCLLTNRGMLLATVDGKERWLDVAFKTERWDELPQICLGCSALVLRAKGPYLLETPLEGGAGGDRLRGNAERSPEEGWAATALRVLSWGLIFLAGFAVGRWVSAKAPPPATEKAEVESETPPASEKAAEESETPPPATPQA
jgi:hypothetical protein